MGALEQWGWGADRDLRRRQKRRLKRVIFALIPVLVLLGVTELFCRSIGHIEFLRKHLLGGSNPGFVWPETPIHTTAEMTSDPYSGYRLDELRENPTTRRPPRIPDLLTWAV